jgi:polysaccharide transporter, PST family
VKSYIDKLRSRPNLHIIIANIGWLFLDKILRMGVGLYITLYIARYLGTSQFGTLNYVIAFAAMFLPIATLGLDAIVVHHLSSSLSSKDELLSTVFWLRCLGGVGSYLLAVCGITIFHHNDVLLVTLVSIITGISLIQPFDVIDIWFQSQTQSKYTVFAKNTAFILAALVRVVLINIQAPLISFIIAALLEAALGALGLVILFQIKGNSIKFSKWNTSLAKKLLEEGWPLILSGLSVMIYMRIDQIMLGEMVGDKAVGLYSAATRISEVWYFIPVAISSSVAPSIYAAKEIGEDIYYHRIKRFVKSMFLMSVAIAIPMTFLSKYIVEVLFGNEYIDSGSILAVHTWAAVFVFMGVATSPWFIAEKLTHISFRMTVVGAIFNVLLNLIMIPRWQGMGAAFSTVISYGVSAFLGNSFNTKTHTIFKIQLNSIITIFK